MGNHAADLQENEIDDLSQLMPEEDWDRNRAVLEIACAHKQRIVLGGGLAFSAYSQRWRNTKDFDLFILPASRDAMIAVTREAGFEDYYDQEPYDRSWIYRGFRDGVILDLIWTMPNHRMEVDEAWLTRGREIRMHDWRLKLLPPEELLWSKLYVMQHDRCDWPDLLNVLYAQGERLDWPHLIWRVGEDAPVLGGLLSLFRWLCPARAQALPTWIWEHLSLIAPAVGYGDSEDGRRARLLDTRDWLGPKTEVEGC